MGERDMPGDPILRRLKLGAITLRLERRDDGGLRISSDDMPGLILSGKYPHDICCQIWPALDALAAFKEGTP